MKRGDIVQNKKHKEQIAVCTTNEMQSGYLGVLHHRNGEDVNLLTRANRWQVIEFADGRINRALFPERQEPDHEFEAQYYQDPARAELNWAEARRILDRYAMEPGHIVINYGDPIDRWNEV